MKREPDGPDAAQAGAAPTDPPTVTGPPGTAPRLIIPLVVACAFMMENLDSTIIGTAIPVIADGFGEPPLALSLAVTSYLISLAVFIPVSGWLADRFGTRNVFISAIVVFTLGSAACAASDSLTMLVLSRLLQGSGAAMMSPVGRLVILRSFPRSQYVVAMSYVTIPALIGPAMGPLLGGFIVTHWSWRWIFLVNIPVGLIGIVMAAIFFENHKLAARTRFDLPGILLCGGGLAALVLALESVGRAVLPPALDAVLGAAAVVLLSAYVWHAARSVDPVLDLRLLRFRTFRMAVGAGMLCRIAFGSIPFTLPLLFQLGFGLSPLQSGSLTFVTAAGALVLKSIAPKVLRRFGFRRLLVVNGAITGAMMMGFALFGPETPHWAILATLGTFGFFRSLQFTCINALSYADLPDDRLSRGTSFASMAQQLSVAIGVALAATLIAVYGRLAPDMVTGFHWTLMTVGLLPLIAAGWFSRLTAEDGRQLLER